jgi:glycosyltransferase involved in cell wall biosynthesis
VKVVVPPVRVVHVADYASVYPGSFVPVLRAALEGVRSLGWEGELLFSEAAKGRPWLGELEADGFAVGFLPRSVTEARRRLGALLERTDGTVILHTHFSRFDLPSVLAAARRRASFVVWHEHSELSSRPAVVARNLVKFGLVARPVARFLCVAPHICDQLVKRGAPRGRVEFFPNPLDASRFPAVTPAERVAARERLGIPPDAKLLLHFSWDWERKGGDLFLAAVKELRDAGRHDVIAMLVGGRADGQPAAAALGISDAVRCVEPTDRHGEYYAAADVFVSSSRREGMPFAVAEALSRGLGVVATDLPGQRVQGRGLDARRLVASDSHEIAREIDRLLARDPENTAADAAASHAWVRANMDPEAWTERLVDVYTRVASGRR